MSNTDNITGPFAFKVDVSDEIALTEGDEAADHIISGGHMIDYLKVARALKVGQRIAIRQSGARQGRGYNEAFSRWLAQHPRLALVSKPERAAALWALEEENWPRVKDYLDTLSVEQRQRTNLRAVRRQLEPRPSSRAPGAWRDEELEEMREDYDVLRTELAGQKKDYDVLREKAELIVKALERIGLSLTEDFYEIIVADQQKFKRWLDSMTLPESTP